jgi:zinc transporter
MANSFICAYELNGDGSGTPVEESSLQSGAARAAPLWVHLSARSAEARTWLETQAQLPDETLVEALLAEDTRPRLQARAGGMLLILRGVNLNDNAEPEDMVSIRVWIENDRFISVQLRNLRGVEDMRQRLESGAGPHDIGDLVTTFIEGSIIRLSPVMGDLADGIDELEDRILQMDLQGIREQIISTRRKTIIFNRFLVPQKDIVQKLTEAQVDWLDRDNVLRLQEAQNNITRFVEDLQALRERSHSVQDEVANILTERLNRNTYVFSLIAAIFLPLSFLTGLLGINVPGIPGADDPEAFVVFCGILAAVVVAQVAVFKKLRWF